MSKLMKKTISLEEDNIKQIDIFNYIYDNYGFYGVLDDVKEKLVYGEVTKRDDGLYSISTGGFSDDEHLIHNLTHLLCRFGSNHYVGYLRGGCFYFSEKKHDNNIKIIRV